MNFISGLVTNLRSLVSDRLDGWVNPVTGFGTSRDKITSAHYVGCEWLTDPELAEMYSTDDLASKIVDTYPREEFRVGFGLAGFEGEDLNDLEEYLGRFNLCADFTEARIWGRLFGGNVQWPIVEDGLELIEPLDLNRIQTVHRIAQIDRRWLWPETFYTSGPKAGEIETYRVMMPNAQGQPFLLGLVHESRFVIWPGERTERLQKIRNRLWDNSVLLKPYNALRASGATWQASGALVQDANQGVFKIAKLWDKIASDPTQGNDTQATLTSTGPSGNFLKRIAMMDQLRSVTRSLVLDKDDEDFERKMTSFGGLSDLNKDAWLRVACAADMPLTILTGQSPSGLNASGNSDMLWFQGKTTSNQQQICEPRVLRMLRILCAAQDCPVKALDNTKLKVIWLPLWAPTAAELADIRLKKAQEAQILIETQVILPEEVALTIADDDHWKIDRESREAMLESAGEPQQPSDAPEAPKGAAPADAQRAAVTLAPTDIAKVITVNEARSSQGLGALKLPDGTEDPNGALTVYEFAALKEAAATAQGTENSAELTGADGAKPIEKPEPVAAPFAPGAKPNVNPADPIADPKPAPKPTDLA